ncbi:MAG: MATE family efflux transporter, partial [Eubacterium sp.]
IGYYLCLITQIIPLVPVMVFAPQIVAFFNDDPEVVFYGSSFLRMISPFYLLSCSCDIQNSGLRGAGDVRKPVAITIFSYVVFRQIYLYVVAHYISNTVIPIAMGYPAGWMVCAVLMFIHYRRADLGKYALTGK